MVRNNLMVMLVSLVALCLVPRLLALPITSKPFARNPDHLAWDRLSGDSGGDPLDPSSEGYEKPKKILPKSIFIAPTLQNSLTSCGPNYTRDHLGNCIQTVQINHNQLLINQLNHLLTQHAQQQQTQVDAGDTYDYDYDEPATTPAAAQKDFQKGPFQLTLPAQFESVADSPQALPSLDPIVGSGVRVSPWTSSVFSTATNPVPTTTTLGTTTTKKPTDTLTEILDELLGKDPFGLFPKHTSVKPTIVPSKTAEVTTPVENLPETTTMTSNPSHSVVGEEEEEEEFTTNVDNGVTLPYEQTESVGSTSISQKDRTAASWSTSEFATELAKEQLVPVTSTTTWEETTSDADLRLSNAEGTTTYEVATETPDDINNSNGGIGTVTTSPAAASSSASNPPTTTPTPTTRVEVTETVLPVQVTERKPSFPTISSFLGSSNSGSGLFDWPLRSPISIVTPVSNPFPFQKTTFGSGSTGGSLFKFTVPVTTTPRPTTTTLKPTTITTTEEELVAPASQAPESLLAVANESENSHKMRESLIESEQKELNYENIDANNRFIYHHLNGQASTTTDAAADPPRQSSSTNPHPHHHHQHHSHHHQHHQQTQPQPIIVAEEFRILTQDDQGRTVDESLTETITEKLVAHHRRFKESERMRVSPPVVATPPTTQWTSSSVTTTPRAPTTTTTAQPRTTPFSIFSTATTSKFEEFLRASSNRIRFPGPSVNRQPAPNKLIPNGQVANRAGGEKEKKPFWWFPTGWEVDTKQKEKPVLLRFWTKMPLIPDAAASQRRGNSHNGHGLAGNNRNNRENSKSPSDNLYREVAFQDISRAFQDKRLNGGAPSS